MSPKELAAPCLGPSFVSKIVPPSSMSPPRRLPWPLEVGAAADPVEGVVTSPSACTGTVVPGGGCDSEKYPTGNVGQGSAMVLLGGGPCTSVTGLPYTVPVATSSAGTVKVSCCPSALVAMPMYVVVTSFAVGVTEDVTTISDVEASAALLCALVEETWSGDGASLCAARPLTLFRMLGDMGTWQFSLKGSRSGAGEKGSPAVHFSRMQVIESESMELDRAARQKPVEGRGEVSTAQTERHGMVRDLEECGNTHIPNVRQRKVAIERDIASSRDPSLENLRQMRLTREAAESCKPRKKAAW